MAETEERKEQDQEEGGGEEGMVKEHEPNKGAGVITISLPAENNKPAEQRSSSSSFQWLPQCLLVLKYLFSSALLVFCILLLMTSNSSGKLITGPGAVILFWILILYLGVIEGGQNALVGLQPLDPQIYQSSSHSFTLRAIHLTSQHKGALEKFLMGRQLITVIVIFALNGVGGIHEGCPNLFQLPAVLSAIFCSSGLAIILVTILLGQVTTQILSTRYMIDFINNFLFLFTVYLSIAIECSGILHMVHFVSDTISYLTRPSPSPSTNSNEHRPFSCADTLEAFLYWSRVLLSFLCLGFSLGCVMQEIHYHHTTMWTGVPPFISIVLFFLLLLCVGVLEGLQIALFAAANLNLVPRMESNSPSSLSDLQFDEIPSPLTPSRRAALQEKQANSHPATSSSSEIASASVISTAKKNCNFVFSEKNFTSFVVGRQICVTVLTFVLARISTIDSNHADFSSRNYTTFGVPSGYQNFINTGIVGAFVTTLLGSLIFRVIASRYPLHYLSNPLVAPALCLCMALESTGVMQSAIAIAEVLRILFRFKSDDLYRAEYNCRQDQRQGGERSEEELEEGVEFRI